MLALPLIYLGLIALFSWGAWFYAKHGLDWFFPVVGGTRQVFLPLLLLYLSPVLAGGVLVVFMLKPLFARRRLVDASFPISHLQHPELFRFIGQLCQAVGAPIPSRVDVDLTINASAGFRAGFSSLLGNDIKLVFRVAAGSRPVLPQLPAACWRTAAISPNAPLCGSALSSRSSNWLGRRVYERDAWDEA